jgi:malate dehydrogenase
MTRDDLFNTNASIVANIMKQGAETCPEACFLIISNPVNSTVPIASEILKDAGVYNPKKLFGVTTLDICRANTFVAENQGADVYKTNVNVVGGHAGITILPLLSQVEGATYTQEAKEALTQRIMFGGDEVVKAKAGGGSATLSMAYAGARFAVSTLRALNGEQGVVECAFVESDVASTKFFSSPVELGKDGVEKIHGIGDLDDFEKQKYDEMIPDLEKQIEKGLAFARTYGK